MDKERSINLHHQKKIFILTIIILSTIVNFVGCSSDNFNQSDFEIEISGKKLEKLPKSGLDTVIGLDAPIVSGKSFIQENIKISSAGKPTIILFLAHWCSHCQAEVDMLGPWIKDNPVSDDLKFFAVATSIDKSRPNYPPDKWLDKEVWPVPTLVDDKDSSAGKAFGLTSFPTWIILDSEGKVINRFSGSITTKDFINLTDFLLKEESIEK